MNAAELLRQLVAIPTPSAMSNSSLIDWVEHFLLEHGWQVEILPYTSETGVAKANMIARPAHAKLVDPIDLAFVCHTDTVPYSAAWKSALDLQLSADGKQLHGCGACDVKGALACFLAAVDHLDPASVRPDVALILTADEEIGCKGMEHLLATTSLQIRSAIVSEATSLRPGIAGKGYGLVRVIVSGVEAHSAYPTEGLSAISVAVRFIARLEGHFRRHNAESIQDPLFDPPQSTFNIGVIQGGTAKNIVAGACSFLVEWRPIPGEAPRSMLNDLEWLASQLHAEEPRSGIRIEPLREEPGFAPADEGPLRQRLARLTAGANHPSRPPIGVSFGSEASRIARVAQEVVVMGPGDMHTAHSERECVPVAELDEWTDTLCTLIS